MKSLTVTFLLLVLSTSLWGQFQNKSWSTVQQAKTENVQFQSVQLFDLQGQVESGMESTVSAGSMLTLKSQNLSQLVSNAPEGLTIDIPTNEGTMQIELVRNHLLSPDFAVTTSTSEGNPVPYTPGVYYHGIINGNANSWAAISFFDNTVMGVMGSANTGEMVLGKLQNDAQERYILYATSHFQVPPAYDCNALEIQNETPTEHGETPESYNPENVVRLYFECEYDMFMENGSVSATVNYMTGIYNAVKTLYDNESVNTVVSEIFVWDVADPYTTSSTSTALTAFRNNRTSYNGDLAHLISRGAPAGGGVAWVDQLCGNYGYAYSYVYSYYNQLPTYSWSVNVVAHEMGHNLGAWHTHDCEWDVNGNGTADKAIDGCGPAAGYSGRGSCNTAQLPPAGGGTIMSYCHIVSGVGIDLMNGFGPLPGDLIRDRVYNATCLSPATSCPVTVSFVKTDVTCYGSSDGSATATGSSGILPYVYAWSNGATTATASGLSAGTYTVTVTDNNGNGCSESSTITITQPNAISLSTSTTPASAPGMSDGAIDLNVSGGTSAYSYAWSSGHSTQDVTNIPAGTYSVTVTDQNSCSKSTTVTVGSLGCATIVSFAKTDVSCYGGSDGSATANGSNGTAPYTYAWSTGATTATTSGLPAGTYTVTVTDNNGNGCSKSASITINQPNAISLNASTTPASAPGVSDGTIDLSVSGGTPAYNYAWSSGHSTQDVTNIPEGTYSVTVTDQNSCSKSTTATVGSLGCATIVSFAKTNVSCHGGSDGSATATGSNGIAPYAYAWSTGATTATVNGLSAGTYTVTVTDDNGNGCSKSATITINQPNAISLNASTTPASAPGMSDGTIDLSVNGGNPAYGYAWSSGHSTQDVNNIPEGTYSVTVTDQNTCSKSTTVTVTSGGCANHVSVFPYQESFESGLGLWTQSSSDNFDWTRQSGSTPTNGTGPNSAQTGSYYLFTEANGNSGSAYLTGPCLNLDGLGGASMDFSYHMDGNHMGSLSVQVSTNNGNSWNNIWSKNGNQGGGWKSASVSLNSYLTAYTKVRFVGALSNGPRGDMSIDGINIQATAPPCNEPSLSLSSTDASCNGASNGSATVSASGGVSPYTYSWSNGGTSATITGLSAGSYNVTVTDNTGCEANGSVSVSEPPVMQLAYSTTPESTPGANDGTIDLTVFNGTAPYGYNWSNGGSTEDIAGLPSGTYTVTVTDANGCTESGSVAVNGAPSCNQTVNLPYSEGFESGLGQWKQATNDDFDWTRNSGSTSTKNTGPSAAAEGSWYLFTDGNGQSGPYAMLVSPCIDLTSAIGPELSFARSLNGNQMGTLDLDISTDNGTSWSNIWSLSGDQGSNWQTANVSLNAYQGMVVSLRFTGTRGGMRSAMAIDDISVIDAGAGAMHPNEGIQTTQEGWEWMGLYPNPAKNQVKINMTTEVEKSLPLYLIDASGKRIGLGTAEVPAGQSVVTIDLNNQPAGIYLLVVGQWRDQQSRRLVIQR